MPKLRVFEVTVPAKDFEKITIDDSAAGVDSDKASEAVLITVEDGNIRYRIDGTAANATHGHLLYSGTSLYLASKTAITNLSMIRAGTANANLMVSHF